MSGWRRETAARRRDPVEGKAAASTPVGDSGEGMGRPRSAEPRARGEARDSSRGGRCWRRARGRPWRRVLHEEAHGGGRGRPTPRLVRRGRQARACVRSSGEDGTPAIGRNPRRKSTAEMRWPELGLRDGSGLRRRLWRCLGPSWSRSSEAGGGLGHQDGSRSSAPRRGEVGEERRGSAGGRRRLDGDGWRCELRWSQARPVRRGTVGEGGVHRRSKMRGWVDRWI